MDDARSAAYKPLLSFIVQPNFNDRPPRRLNAWGWIGWLSLMLLLGFAGGQLDNLLIHWFGWRITPNNFQSYLVTHASVAAAAVVLGAPILEECGFRAFLSTSPRAVFIGLAVFLSYVFLIGRLLFVRPPAAVALRDFFYAFWVLLPAGALSLLLYVVARERVLRLFRRHSVWIFWVSCILFGTAHAALYSNRLVWWSVVLVLPQFVVGVGLAYIRVTFGLRWSIATHMAYDGIIVAASWFYVATAAGSAAREHVQIGLVVLGLLMLAYGLVMLQRVLVRQR